MRRVTLSRRKGQTYGFHLSGGTENGTGFFITKVEDGSIAQREGIKAGDEVLEVGGRRVGGASHSDVTHAIGGSASVSLLLRGTAGLPVAARSGDPLTWRPVSRSPTKVSAPRSATMSSSSNGPIPNGFAVNIPAYNSQVPNGSLPNGALKVILGPKPGKNGVLHVGSNPLAPRGAFHVPAGAPHISNSAPRIPNGAPHSNQGSLLRSEGPSVSSHKKGTSGPPVHSLGGKSGPTSNGVLGPRRVSPSAGGPEVTHFPHRPGLTGDLVERLLRVVIAAAGKSTLGFSITHDQGVTTVATVLRGGPAWVAGLRERDRIVACNGRPVASMTHEQVVAEMKKNQAAIALEVKRLVKCEQITGESSGYNSSASSTTGDQASPTTTTTPRRRRPNIRVSRDPASSRLVQGRIRARQLELHRIEGHWAAAEEEEAERRRRGGPLRGVSRSHSASDLLDSGLYCVHSSGGGLSASVSSLTAVGADSSADDHDSSGCEGVPLTPSAGALVSNIVVSSSVSCDEEDAICRLERLEGARGDEQAELQEVEARLQRIRERQLMLARQERQLLNEKTIYVERRQLQLDRSSPRTSTSVHSPSDSETLYSHGPPSSVSSGSPPTPTCGKHTSRILIKSCPPPPPLRQENTLGSSRDCLGPPRDCCNSHSRHCCCRETPSRAPASRNSPPSSPSSSSGVSCSSHTLQSSSVSRSKSFDTLSSHHLEDGRNLGHWDESKVSQNCPTCHRLPHDKTYSSSSDHDRTHPTHDDTYTSSCSAHEKSRVQSSSVQLQRSSVPVPPAPTGLPIIPRPPPLRMGDEITYSTTTSNSSSSSSSAAPVATDVHKTNFAAALSDVVSKRNARLTEDDALDDGARAEAYEAKIDAYKREKLPPADSKKMQHDMLMEEFKRKHQKIFDGEERSRPLTPVAPATTAEVRYFGPSTTTTGPKSTVSTGNELQSSIVSAAIGPKSTVSAATGPKSNASAATEPKSTVVSTMARSQNTTSSSTARPLSTVSTTNTKLQSTSVVRPQSTIIIGSNAASESSSTLPTSVNKTTPGWKKVKAVEVVEKGDPFASKIVTRSASSSVVTRPDAERKVVTTASRQKEVRGEIVGSANNNEGDGNSVLHFWKKQETALNAPAGKPKAKAPVQATKSFSGLKTNEKVSSSPSTETNGVFPVVLKKTAVEPTIVEDVNENAETSSTLQLIKTFNSIASSAPKKSGPTTRPKSVVLVTNNSQVKVSGASDAPKTAASTTMKPVTSIDRTPRLVSQQVPSKYTVIPPPLIQSSDRLSEHSDFTHSRQTSSYISSLPQPTPSNTSKVYVSVNGDSLESNTYLSDNGVNSDSDRHFPELTFPEAFPASLSSSANLNFTIRNVSPTELIIPEPPSSSAELSPEIPRGVPPPPPACGDSWSERYERRLFTDDAAEAPPTAAQEREVSSDFKNLFVQPDPAQPKPLVAINAYKPS